MWKLLKEFILPFRAYLFFAFILVIGVNIFSLVEPLIMRRSIDQYIYRRAVYIPDSLKEEGLDLKPLMKTDDGGFYKYADIPSYYRKIIENKLTKRDIVYFPQTQDVNVPYVVAQNNKYIFVKNEDLRKIPLKDVMKMRKEDMDKLKFIAWVLILISISKFLFNYAYTFILTYIAEKTMHNLRIKIMNHLVNQPLEFFNKHQIGWLVTRATNDVKALANFFSGFIVNVAKDILLLIGLFIILFRISFLIGIMLFLALPAFTFILLFFKKYFYSAYDKVRKHLSRINAHVQESLSGVRIIQSFSMVEKHYNSFSDIANDYFKALMEQLNVMAIFRPIIDVFNNVILAILIVYGGILIIMGNISIGTIVLAFSYAQMVVRPIANISENFNVLQSTKAAVNRIIKILNEPLEEKNGIKKDIEGNIKLEEVSFQYTKDNIVLKNINIYANKGEIIALVGATGSGKTTVMNLLMGFYIPQKGKVLIDGVEVKDYDYDFLRKKIGLVMQDIFMLDGTLAENIALEEDYDMDKIKQIGEIIGLDEIVRKYENGYLMHINEGGTNLSVGERQLIAFARAMYVDPTILMLDEATASVDSHTEKLIQKATEEVMKGRTTIVVAHRLSTIKHADRIYVLRNGQIVETGTHKELIENKGYYFTLYSGQMI